MLKKRIVRFADDVQFQLHAGLFCLGPGDKLTLDGGVYLIDEGIIHWENRVRNVITLTEDSVLVGKGKVYTAWNACVIWYLPDYFVERMKINASIRRLLFAAKNREEMWFDCFETKEDGTLFLLKKLGEESALQNLEAKTFRISKKILEKENRCAMLQIDNACTFLRDKKVLYTSKKSEWIYVSIANLAKYMDEICENYVLRRGEQCEIDEKYLL
ncbi:hypothetical protein [Listeria booriae]|uniref:hypothetical protein n=1 Tax=Listeria booriae TaxID=1552123 RepID=UPI001626AF20|nr:hypothetical protein [Listeria booriae]MBC2069390.1 hypothetical protein [Listeria booriae]